MTEACVFNYRFKLAGCRISPHTIRNSWPRSKISASCSPHFFDFYLRLCNRYTQTIILNSLTGE